MKARTVAILTGLGLTLFPGPAAAQPGEQPRRDIKPAPNLTPDEQKLQQFWIDYYDSLQRYYQTVDNIDWAEYYRRQDYRTNGRPCPSGNCGGIGPNPIMQWADPARPFAHTLPPPMLPWAVPHSPPLPVSVPAVRPEPQSKAAGRESDGQKLQGTWLLVGLEGGDFKAGDELPRDKQGCRLKFDGDKAGWVGRDPHATAPVAPPPPAPFRLDPKQDPKHLDWSGLPGIYKLEGDRLWLCSGVDNQRPRTFHAYNSDTRVVYVLRREVPAPQPDTRHAPQPETPKTWPSPRARGADDFELFVEGVIDPLPGRYSPAARACANGLCLPPPNAKPADR